MSQRIDTDFQACACKEDSIFNLHFLSFYCSCQFVPLVYPARHSKDLRYMTGNFVFEIHVKKGEDGEIYETPEHNVSVVNITVSEVIRRTKIC